MYGLQLRRSPSLEYCTYLKLLIKYQCVIVTIVTNMEYIMSGQLNSHRSSVEAATF